MRAGAVSQGDGPAGRMPPPLVILGIGIADRLPAETIARATDPAAVHTPGFVEFADMPAIYSLARALVFPSRYESFGIPIVEAMGCGCPVIPSTPSAGPVVAGDAGVLVDPDDLDGLADAMGRVAFDDRLAAELSARGLRRAEQFSWTRSALSLLGELRGAARPRTPRA
jgi:glycosyltransferase involved in cell wall biosynthesis